MTHYQDHTSNFTAMFVQRTRSQFRRIKLYAGLIGIMTLGGALALPLQKMPKQSREDAYLYAGLSFRVWLADAAAVQMTMGITIDGVTHEMRVVDYPSPPPFPEIMPLRWPVHPAGQRLARSIRLHCVPAPVLAVSPRMARVTIRL